jgi:hypothetical protein
MVACYVHHTRKSTWESDSTMRSDTGEGENHHDMVLGLSDDKQGGNHTGSLFECRELVLLIQEEMVCVCVCVCVYHFTMLHICIYIYILYRKKSGGCPGD